MQILFILFTSLGFAFPWSSGFVFAYADITDLIQTTPASEIDLDFTKILYSKNGNQDVIFSEAVRLLERIKSSSSCSRTATAELLSSCQQLDDNPKNREDFGVTGQYPHDDIKSLYAARLALCELVGAGSPVPSSCSSLYITTSPYRGVSPPWKSDGPDTKQPENVPHSMLEPCLKSLESRPQWWTSYSNNRQNAVVICQAARMDIETTQLLKLHRSLTEHTASVNEALKNAIHDAGKVASVHKQFVRLTSEMRDNLVQEIEQTASEARNIIIAWLNGAETSILSAARKITSGIHEVGLGSNALAKGIKGSSNEVARLREDLRQIRNEHVEVGDKLSHTQQQAVLAGQELSLTLKSSMDKLVTDDMARISETVNSVEVALEWLSQRLDAIYQQESLISQNLRNFEHSLNMSQIRATELLNAQNWQAQTLESHSRMQMDFGKNAKVAHAMLERLTSKAASLESVLEDAIHKAYDIPAFGGTWGFQFSPWTLCSLLFACLAVQSPRMTILLLVSGSFLLIYKLIY